MNNLTYLLEINPNYIIVGMLAFFFTLEQTFKNPFKFKNRGHHLLQNIPFQVLIVGLNIFFVTFQVYCIDWLNEHQIGLLYLIQLPFWVTLFVGVLLYDFFTYWVHRSSHKFTILWKLHRVHHSDTTMDSSTVFRFHPIEPIFVYGVGNIITAAIFGTDVLSMALYYFILYTFFFLEHSNLHYPTWINNTLGLVFVTPNQHRVHHQQNQIYTDSNFADIFIIWDRIFGTFKEMPLEQMKYGLKEFESKEKQSFWYLLKSPFMKIERINSDK